MSASAVGACFECHCIVYVICDAKLLEVMNLTACVSRRGNIHVSVLERRQVVMVNV